MGHFETVSDHIYEAGMDVIKSPFKDVIRKLEQGTHVGLPYTLPFILH